MRHFFLLAVTEALLAIGVLPGSAVRPLVRRTSSTHRFTLPDLATAVGAVDLAVVTPAANGDRLMAARAVE